LKLLIIGHSVEDHILSSNAEQVKPGGIFYSASALNNFKEPADEITILTAVEESNYHLFSSLYDKLNKRYCQTVDSIPKVFLTVNEDNERDECYNRISDNLRVDLTDINSFDGILINMITGFDINLDQLKMIRKTYNSLIYFDVHTLSRGFEEDGKRNFRIIPEFNEWAKLIDIIQANEHELLTLSNIADPLTAVKEMLNAGTKYFILTMENRGARIFFLKDGELNSSYRAAVKVDIKNKIGCGDVFGAVFFYTYLKFKDFEKSLDTANTAAGITASYSGLNEFVKLKEDVFSRYN